MGRRPLIAGNWKMHGDLAAARALAAAVAEGAARLSDRDVVICPPHVHLEAVGSAIAGSRVALGAQTVSEFEQGAYTGEVSTGMLRDLACRYVIVGHSERRHLFGESNEAVGAKARAVVAAGLVPIVCVGEQLEDRRGGTTESVIAAQLAVLDATVLRAAVIAYEPVWAIGTGETATPDQAQAVHDFVRATIGAADAAVAAAIRILYGGSVKPGNAKDLFRMPDVDGGLIGGAALKAQDFLQICEAA